MNLFFKLSFCLILFALNSNTLSAQVIDNALEITSEGDVKIPAGNLDVKGKITTEGNLEVTGDINTTGNLVVKGKITTEGNLDTKGNVNTSGKLQEKGNDLLPRGAIIMWYGTTAPAGWAICDGKDNITPDLRGRFVVGVGASVETSYSYKETGGMDKPTISTKEMPTHTHELSFPYSSTVMSSTANKIGKGSGMGNTNSLYDTGTDTSIQYLQSAVTIKDSGSSQPFDNRPKYYALYYIMKL